jgi:hypothetical protein
MNNITVIKDLVSGKSKVRSGELLGQKLRLFVKHAFNITVSLLQVWLWFDTRFYRLLLHFKYTFVHMGFFLYSNIVNEYTGFKSIFMVYRFSTVYLLCPEMKLMRIFIMRFQNVCNGHLIN